MSTPPPRSRISTSENVGRGPFSGAPPYTSSRQQKMTGKKFIIHCGTACESESNDIHYSKNYACK